MNTVLVVDDKEMMRDSVGATLQRAGFTVITAEGGQQALSMITSRRPDAVVTDLKMPGMTGTDLLGKVREFDDELPVILMTAFAEVATAVEAMKLGAFDYITKPFQGDELIIAVKRAMSHAMVLRENAVLRAAAQGPLAIASGARPTGIDRIVGISPAIKRVKEQVMAVAESQGTVMICGESGAGKEVIARAIHEHSVRKGSPFLAVNCAALSESLLESELFGHERGAFTGADKLRKGRFELSDGGSLLLDEVSEITPQIQAKLLRVLQERSFERVGSSASIGVDVRVIATSNRDLPSAVSRSEFRQDLFFRLNVLPIHVPPLRDRLEDVPALVEHFVGHFCRREGRPPIRFDTSAMTLMQTYHWPGNVRELMNICERAVVLNTVRPTQPGKAAASPKPIARDSIEPWLMPAGTGHASEPRHIIEPKPLGAPTGSSSEQAPVITVRPLEDLERDAIVFALRRFNGHRQKTATALGIGVRTLGLKLKKWKQEKLVSESL
jgi:two-component system, NtrC family, response regulator HydG